jgi:hypothetical protein
LQRVLSTAALVGLLIATAAAFAITERLKLVKSPIYGTYVSKWISPTCGCARGKAKISVKLRRGDDVTVTILDAGRHVVATLAAGKPLPRGRADFSWDGTTDAGGRAPDGVYRPEIHLARQHRTILLPNRIGLDTHAPKVLDASIGRGTVSPDGDNVGDSVRIAYRFNSPAHAVLYLDSKRVLYSRIHKPTGKLTWHARVDGKPLKAGTYTLYLGGVDLAGNLTPASLRRQIVVRVRYIELAHDVIRVQKPGVRFSVGVQTDARTYWWKLNGRRGTATSRVLRLVAPSRPGTYTLAVGERSYTAHAKLIVGQGR